MALRFGGRGAWSESKKKKELEREKKRIQQLQRPQQPPATSLGTQPVPSGSVSTEKP